MRSLIPLVGIYAMSFISPLYGGDKTEAAKRGLEVKPLYNGIEAAYNANGQFQPRAIFVNSAVFKGAEIIFGSPLDLKMVKGKRSSYAARHYVCISPSDGNLYGAVVIESGNNAGKERVRFSPAYGIRCKNKLGYVDLSTNNEMTDVTVNEDIKIGKCVLNPFASIKIPHQGKPGKKKIGKYIETQLNITLWKHIKCFFRHEIYNDNKQGFVAVVSANF